MKCVCTHCVYCGAEFGDGKHEHDHFPIPFRAGGDECVPACLDCHTLKDRRPWAEWDAASGLSALASLPPEGRILMAQLVAQWHADWEVQSRLMTLQAAVESACASGSVAGLRRALKASRERPKRERAFMHLAELEEERP